MADRHPLRPDRDDVPQSPETAGRADEPGSPERHPAPPADVRSLASEEMGGEAPCQLHRFWDVDE
jgi:hypothetical protein